eukprot:1932316-Amphidinium_carterae.1
MLKHHVQRRLKERVNLVKPVGRHMNHVGLQTLVRIFVEELMRALSVIGWSHEDWVRGSKVGGHAEEVVVEQ